MTQGVGAKVGTKETVPGEATVDIAIVGGGAAGLAAAIFAAEQNPRLAVHVLDGAKSLGAKILVSGGGRCNVTHETVTADDFFGTRHLVRNVLATFPVSATVAWFTSMGVDLKREETGKLFPVTDKARTVLDALIRRCRELGVVLRPAHRVKDIVPGEGTGETEMDEAPPYTVRYQHGQLDAHRVILATGGRYLPRAGSDGAGYEFARRHGHQVTRTVPALVALVLDSACFHRTLSGLSQEVQLTTVVQGKSIDRRRGSLLWTHFGISGPVVMDASRFWTRARAAGHPVELFVNFLPGRTVEQARERFLAQATKHPRRSVLSTLAELVPERFAETFCRHVSCNPQTTAGNCARADREQLLAALTRFPLPVIGDRGWNFAEVTAGGIPLEEVDYRTMESKRRPGLYLVGEMLDCDGRIGGFNFQWAWATGFLAGRAAASSCCER